MGRVREECGRDGGKGVAAVNPVTLLVSTHCDALCG